MTNLRLGARVVLPQLMRDRRATNLTLAMSYVAEVLQAIPPKVLSGQQSKRF